MQKQFLLIATITDSPCNSGVDSRKFNLWKRDLTLYDISDSRPMVRNTGRWEGLNTPLSHGDLVSPDTSTLQDETEDEDEDDMEAPYNGMNAYDIMDVALAVEEVSQSFVRRADCDRMRLRPISSERTRWQR